MQMKVFSTADVLSQAAAHLISEEIEELLSKQDQVTIVFSTGSSQLKFFDHLILEKVDWAKVRMFHLDEYINLPETHEASFRKYLTEKFIDQVGPLKEVYLVDGNQDPATEIARLSKALKAYPIDIGLIGIGGNAHIAFNDPPANFSTTEAFHVVNLEDRCKLQQVEEGWFAEIGDVPDQAISMTIRQIMQCKLILSIVPYLSKAEAVLKTLETPDPTPEIPATILKTHPNFHLYLDEDSASLLPDELRERYE